MFNFINVPNLDFKLESTESDGKRYYKAPNGALYPSVTTVLSSMNKKGIMEWRKRVGEEEANKKSSFASSRGTRVHKLCENFVLGKEIKIENPYQSSLFFPLKKEIEKNINNIYGVEKKLYSDRLQLAGTVDLIAEYNKELSIIDYKTSGKLKQEDHILNYFFQATCYSLMFEELTGLKAKQIVVMIAVENENEPQIFLKKRKDYIMPLLEFLKNEKVCVEKFSG